MENNMENKILIKSISCSLSPELQKKFPFIDELVDSFYTREIIELIEKSTTNNLDIQSFHFFQSLFLYCFVYCQKTNILSKENVKNIIKETINNPEQRKKFLNAYTSSVNKLLT